MRALRRTWNRLLGTLFGRRREAELARELEAHIQMQAEDNQRLGMAPAAARRAAVLKFGGVEAAKESCREQRGLPQLDLLLRDLRYGLRQLRRSAGLTVVVVLTLALGIGANTAVFSAMNAVLLRYLPLPEPRRLVYLNSTVQYGSQTGDGDSSLTEYLFEQLRTQRRVFADLVAFAPLGSDKVGVRYGKEPEEAFVDMVSGDFFSGLGVRSALGRQFTLEDEHSHAHLAVLSDIWWKRRLGGDPAVIGRPLYIKGVPFTIAGVAAAGFTGVEHGRVSEIWIPLQSDPYLKPWGTAAQGSESLYGSALSWWCLKTMGRLAPGVSEKQALAELGPVFQRAALAGVGELGPKQERARLYFTSARGIDGLRDDFERPLRVLAVMVGLVLAIACANVAMLLLARSAARQRELSLRMALGGSRARLFRQLFTESMLLVLGGGALGWLFGLWATRALAAWTRLSVSLAPDRSVLIFTAAVSLLTALVFGLAPWRSVVRAPIGLALQASAATAFQDRAKLRSGQLVVALQVALCLALLVGAGLLLQTLRNLEAIDLGIRTPGLLVFGLAPQQRVRSDAGAVRFYQALIARLRILPGVEAATLMQHRVGTGWSWNASARLDGAKDGHLPMRWNAVGADYFRVLGTPVLHGRDFTEADAAASPKVVIVDQVFAERYLPAVDPLGHQVAVPWAKTSPYVIVGVAANSKYTGVRDDNRKPTAYFPYEQVGGLETMNVELRTAGKPAALLPAVRRLMAGFAPELPLLQPMTQEEQFGQSFSLERVMARLSVFFALLAALLVATGLYGTLAYKVSRRTAEVGVRMALGAQRRQVLWLVLRGSLAVSLAGALIGLPLAAAGARLLRATLYGVAPGDPWSFAAALAGLALVAVAASLIPARRAASVDPMAALRCD
ncbi:MAG TPA: ABC transporter permease [Thermoanaerobaculia bacterium]|nr:ABC transporter permease [Thermoanaerobaculia bacterium]